MGDFFINDFSCFFYKRRQLPDGPAAHQKADIELVPFFTEHRNDTDCFDRVSAQRKEILCHADRIHAQHLRKCVCKLPFHLRFRFNISFLPTAFRLWQCPFIELAVDRKRKFLKRQQKCGHHIKRQPYLQNTTEFFRRNRIFRIIRGVIATENLFVSVTIGNHRDSILYAGDLTHCRPDLPELDPKAPQLHLIVYASQKFDIAIR